MCTTSCNIAFIVTFTLWLSMLLTCQMTCHLFSSTISKHWPQKQQTCRDLGAHGALEPWRVEIGRAMQFFLAPPPTRTAYNRNAQIFLDFRTEHAWGTSWPVSMDAVMHFTVYLYQSGLTVSYQTSHSLFFGQRKAMTGSLELF